MTILPTEVKHSGMSDNLGSDVIAVDALGNILSRATTEEGVRRAAPDAVAVFGAADFAPAPAAPAKAATATPPPVEEMTAKAPKPATGAKTTNVVKNAAPAKGATTGGEAFDHDGDGRTGGSRKRKLLGR